MCLFPEASLLLISFPVLTPLLAFSFLGLSVLGSSAFESFLSLASPVPVLELRSKSGTDPDEGCQGRHGGRARQDGLN